MPHIHEKIDFTVEVFVVYKNKVLLRKHDKYRIWLGVGGHVELDEDPIQAAIRETKEEVGLDIVIAHDVLPRWKGEQNEKELAPPKFLNRHNIDDVHEHIAMVYFATAVSDRVVATGRDRSEEWHWFTKEELDQNAYGIKENIIFYAKRALEELGN